MVSDQIIFALKQKIEGGESVYSIAKATGVAQSVIGRFLSEERKQIRSETIDRLCEYLGLELAEAKSSPKSPATSPARPASKPAKGKATGKPAKASKRPTKK